MFKLTITLFCFAAAVAQDLDAMLLDIYGPDMTVNMIYKNSEEAKDVVMAEVPPNPEEEGVNAEVSPIAAEGADVVNSEVPPIAEEERVKRQVSTENDDHALAFDSCFIGTTIGRCVPYYLCTNNLTGLEAASRYCPNTLELCCPSSGSIIDP